MCDTFEERYSQTTRYIKHRVSDSAALVEVGDETSENKFVLKPAFWNSLLAGGVAGVVVDFSLYPLDTVKTRLQTDQGFRAAGGFKKLYKGIVPILVCSAPVSALFFCVYNSIINVLRTEKTQWDPVVYVIAASAAEVLCSTVRVPLEILKQRKQTSNTASFNIIQQAVKKEGYLGLYRGFSSTIAREVPFACIQFPLWEYMIEELIIYQNGEPLTALQTATCGAIAGGIAGAVTTPMDVIKTRIMLAEKEKIEIYKPRVYQNFAYEVFHERGIRGIFSGVVPRVLWIMLGGFIYFGTYEEVKLLCEHRWCALKWKIQKFGKWLPGNLQTELAKFWENLTCVEYDDKKNLYASAEEKEIICPETTKSTEASFRNESATEVITKPVATPENPQLTAEVNVCETGEFPGHKTEESTTSSKVGVVYVVPENKTEETIPSKKRVPDFVPENSANETSPSQ